MKKSILFVLMYLATATTSHSQNVNIPDANFKAYLVGNNAINTNMDTEIQVSEASAFTGSITCNSQSISDLTGLEAFTGLSILNASNNPLGTIDISQNTDLQELHLALCQLTSLDASANSALVEINCSVNPLTYLNVANGNNTNMPGSGFSATSISGLSCIQVDDVAYSTANWTSVDASASFSTNCGGSILVSSIAIQGQGGASTITVQGGTLQMEVSVMPMNADDASFTLSVTNGTGSASINATGLLTAISDGTVDVIATANDASGVTGTATIMISNQSVGIDELNTQLVTMYPNPVQNELHVEFTEEINEINIIDCSGKVLQTITDDTHVINVSNLSKGVYTLHVSTDTIVSTKRFVKI